MKKLLAVLALLFAAFHAHAAVTQLNLLSFGADPSGVRDSYSAVTNALQAGATLKLGVYAPGGRYKLSQTVFFPYTQVGTDRRFHTQLQGDFASYGSKSTDGANNPGTVFFTTGNFTAFATPIPVPDIYANWIGLISFRDIYVLGPQNAGSSLTASVGISIVDCISLQAGRVHVEGFGTGILLKNGADLVFDDWVLVQNNYYGIYAQRTNNTDMQVWFSYLSTLNNQINIMADNVRSFWVKSGQNIANLVRATPLPRVIATNSSNSQLHFENYTAENDENIETFRMAGEFSQLTIENSNFESTQSGIIRAERPFDSIVVRNSNADRGVLATFPGPPWLVLTNSAALDDNVRSCTVTLDGNSPDSANYSVRNDFLNRNILEDVIPPQAIQINQVPTLDRYDENYLQILGNFAFTTNNVQCGTNRLYWTINDPANSAIRIIPARPMKGADTLTVTFVCYDDGGATIPQVYDVGGIGSAPNDWIQIYRANLGSWTVGVRTFNKYQITVAIKNKTTAAANGVRWVGLSGFYGGGIGSEAGIECANVYTDGRHLGDMIPLHLNKVSYTGNQLQITNYAQNVAIISSGMTNAEVATFISGTSYVATNGPSITFRHSNTNTGERLASIKGMFSLDGDGGYGTLAFGTRKSDADGILYSAYLDEHGFLGLGVLRPQARLHVDGVARADTYWINSGADVIPGQSATIEVLNSGGAMNHLEWTNGILITNIGGVVPNTLQLAASNLVTITPDVNIIGSLNVSGAIAAPTLNLTTLNTGTLSVTNGVIYKFAQDGPSAATIGAYNFALWASNAVSPTAATVWYRRDTTDGIAATDTLIPYPP